MSFCGGKRGQRVSLTTSPPTVDRLPQTYRLPGPVITIDLLLALPNKKTPVAEVTFALEEVMEELLYHHVHANNTI
jgi:hypothetical protein